MDKQQFVQGAWRTARSSKKLRFALILVAAAVAGVAAGRALGVRGDSPQAESGAHAVASPPPSEPAPAKPSPGTGTTVQQEVQVPPQEAPPAITEIPSVDFKGLSASQKQEAIKVLNEHRCTCNCNMTLAQCRRDDKNCPRSPAIVSRFMDLVRKGTEPAKAAEQMYGADAAAPAGMPAPGAPAAAQPGTGQPGPGGKLTLYKVDPGDAPSIGPKDAPVMIIEFLDFQCPFCGRANDTVQRILGDYPGKVRVVFKQHALAAIHPQATTASEVALAANEQGRYIEMHNKLFSIQRELNRDRMLAAAGEVGLDVAKVTAALDSGKFRSAIEADTRQAESLGASGTPAFFINGRYVSGARPYEQFKAVIDEELSGRRPPFQWGTNVRNEMPAAQAQPGPDPNKIYTVDLKGAPSTGAAKATVTIVEFTDFQCPFCKRVQPTLKQILQDYQGKVRLVSKNLPLSFHAQARPAARAALAAQKQGKYWELRDLMFGTQGALTEEALMGHARTVGLDVERFRADMASPEIEQRIAQDEKQAQEVGATGTPTFLINGHLLVGAQPLEAFKQAIDQELSRSRGGAGAKGAAGDKPAGGKGRGTGPSGR